MKKMVKDLILLAAAIAVVLISSFIGYQTGKAEEHENRIGENELYYQLGRECFINELNNIMDGEYIHRDGMQVAKKINENVGSNYIIFVKNSEEGYIIKTEYCD